MRSLFVPASLVILVAFGGGGCAGSRAAGPAPIHATPDVVAEKEVRRVVELEPMRIDVVQTPRGEEARSYDARSLLDEGNESLVLHKYDDALAAYDHLLVDFPDSRLVPPALFNAGQALEGKEDWTGAADRYRRLLHDAPATAELKEDRKNAYFRLAAVLAESGSYPDSIQALEQVLDWNDLSAEERVEALARLGFALIETRDYAGGEEVLRSAIAFHATASAKARFESPYFVGMAQFYLAEIPRLQFLAIPMRYPEEQMRRDVEQKSQLFLLARDRYVKTVDYRSPYWATAGVFQVASMYKEFWDEWMAVPVPADFNAAETKEYVRQVNEEPQLRKLLEKALFFHEKNIAMARNAGVETPWSRESETDVVSVREVLARQQRGDYVTPGSGQAPTPGTKPISPDSASVQAPAVYIPPRFEL
jgi:tetratricopeptide (TPR) repeat protein